nr:hypothetical protein [Lentzea albidocapillata]
MIERSEQIGRNGWTAPGAGEGAVGFQQDAFRRKPLEQRHAANSVR